MNRLSAFSGGVALLSLASLLFVQTQPLPSVENTVPSRVLLTWSGDPSTTATVTWRTNSATPSSLAQIAVASADPRFIATATQTVAEAQTVSLAEGGTATYHTAQFQTLKPDTRYSYRVGDGTTWSEWFDFKTASAESKPFTFIYFGDAQNDVKSMWSRVIRQAQRDAPYADFMLHAGDLINRAEVDAEWADWFYAGGWLHSTIPSIAVPGNHEYASGKLSRLWQPQFQYPRNGVPGLEDTNYYIDFQGTRIISLNSNERTEEQAAWLEKTLAETKTNWTILTFHHPMYSTAKGRDNVKLRDLWLPIILKHKVDLVLQGHDHSYGRMNLPSGTNEKKGVTHFVVSVSGPKMYELGDDAKTRMTNPAENTQLYQIITVTPTMLKYRAHTATGKVYDEFTVEK
ncbi:MAG: metallophosphoesterase family protein [Fimbriimonadaceae bacterium]|nr:metallophosphoesterase family protein [Fimbriimonadaceae bacterium]